jgi:hypothetical protein
VTSDDAKDTTPDGEVDDIGGPGGFVVVLGWSAILSPWCNIAYNWTDANMKPRSLRWLCLPRNAPPKKRKEEKEKREGKGGKIDH